MSTLIVQIPPRQRLQARQPAPAQESALSTEYAYVLSPDGLATTVQGRAPVALLPKAAGAVAVLADADVSWHRITLPKAPAARLQAALVGVLEDALLEEAAAVHIAVAPEATAGESTWVAVVDRAWLTAELATLEKANIFIDRVVPISWPDEPPSGHFAEVGDPSQGATLTWAHSNGVVQINLQGTLARSLLPNPLPEGTRWSATPATASAAERWLGVPMTVMDWPQRALQASRSLWNLRQFTLARKNRGTRALRDLWRQFQTPGWKPTRYGLATLLVVQVVGINLWASHQSHTVRAKRDAMVTLLKQTHPHVGSGVLDAPVQMSRETDTLRAAAGIPGESDLEPMLQAAANAWPGDRPPVDNLRYEPGRLSLSAAGWNQNQIEQFSNQLRPRGWRVEARDGLLTLSRAPAGAATGRPL